MEKIEGAVCCSPPKQGTESFLSSDWSRRI